MIADASRQVVSSALGQLRLHLAGRLDLIRAGEFRPVWVTDFPLFEAAEGGVTSSHHPFTSPDRTDFDPADQDELLKLRSRAYDLVINGEEIGGGSIRINDREVQHRVFRALGLSEAEVREKFGYFLRALDYGAPPHGGLALGFDRVVSMILATPSIREVIAFPKNRSAWCPLTQAPSPVSREQLVELNLHVPLAGGPLPGSGRGGHPVDSLSWVSRIGVDEGERAAAAEALEQASRLAGQVNARAGQEEPAFSAAPLAERVRDGLTARVSPLAEKGDLLSNAPATKDGFFKVASVLE
jgi:aspartyl-tRNA synthetase